mgnify:CR=1 FL=1
MAAKGFKGLKPKTGNKDSLRLEELFDGQKFPDDKWLQLRFIEKVDPLVVKQHWIKILGGKDKREITIPRFCIAFDPNDPDTPKEGMNCPYCEISSGKDGAQRASEFFLINAIVRDIQEEEPAKKAKHTKEEEKTGFKDMRSKSWTPIRVIRLPGTVVARIQELGETNIQKDKKTKEKAQYDASHPKYGFDVQIKYKPKAAGTDKYSCDKVDGGPTPLSSEEKEYLVYKLDESLLDQAGRMSQKQADEDFKRMDIMGDIPDDDEEDDDEPKGKKSKKKGRSLDDDDDDDDVPSNSKKKGKKSKPFEDDEDDEDEDDEDDEDEKPKKSSKKSSSKDKVKDKKKSKKSKDDDDEDDDEDDEDEDEKPKKSSKKSSSKDKVKDKAKSKKKASKDDDDDEDEDEDDEDEKPKKSSKDKSKSKDKTKSKDKVKPKKKASKDDDDEDEDDEDEDEKPKKSSKSKDSGKKKKSKDDDKKSSGKKKKKKASSINDDDDE